MYRTTVSLPTYTMPSTGSNESSGDLPVVLTGQGDVFSAGIDFQYSFVRIFGSGSHDTIRQWYRTYRETNLRIL